MEHRPVPLEAGGGRVGDDQALEVDVIPLLDLAGVEGTAKGEAQSRFVCKGLSVFFCIPFYGFTLVCINDSQFRQQQ